MSEKKKEAAAAKCPTGMPLSSRRPALQKRNSQSRKGRQISSQDPLEEWERSLESLKKKSLLYAQLGQGEDLALTEAQKDGLLVDFDRKNWSRTEQKYVPSLSYSEKDTSASLSNPLAFLAKIYNVSLKEDLVEYLDEFGRTRFVTPDALEALEKERHETFLIVQHSQSNSESLPTHYDSAAEVRNKGIGFFKFSTEELERQKQMMELDELRKNTHDERSRYSIQKARRVQFLDKRRAAAVARRQTTQSNK